MHLHSPLHILWQEQMLMALKQRILYQRLASSAMNLFRYGHVQQIHVALSQENLFLLANYLAQ